MQSVFTSVNDRLVHFISILMNGDTKKAMAMKQQFELTGITYYLYLVYYNLFVLEGFSSSYQLPDS